MNSITCAVAVADFEQQRALALADNAEKYYEPIRKEYIDREIDKMMKDKQWIFNLLLEALDSNFDSLLAVGLRDAFEESGKCWDAITGLEAMLRSFARIHAAAKWDDMPHDYESDLAEDRADFERES